MKDVAVLAPIPDIRFFSFAGDFAGADGTVPAIRPVFGRPVASGSFVEAVIRHGRGTYIIIAQSGSPATLDALAEFCRRTAPERVRIVAPTELPELLSSGRVGVLHDAGSEGHLLVPSRSRFGDYNVPITGSVHTVASGLADQIDIVRIILGNPELDTLICHSRASAQAIQARLDAVTSTLRGLGLPVSAPSVRVLPLGVQVEQFERTDRASARRALGIPEHAVLGLYFGRFSPSDKADLLPLLDAFKAARLRCSADLRLVLAGEDRLHYATWILEQAQSRGLADSVKLVTGSFAPYGRTKRDIFSASDLLVLPVDNGQETFGLVLLEAMLVGLPVIASDLGGHRDIVRDGQDGFLIRTCSSGISPDLDAISALLPAYEDGLLMSQAISIDVDELAHALQLLGSDDALRARMGASARARVEACFDWRVVLRRYEDLWSELQERAAQHGRSDSVWAARKGRSSILGVFPSMQLRDDMVVQITAAGQEALARESSIAPEYSVLRDLTRDWNPHELLRAAREPISVGQLRELGLLAVVSTLLPDGFPAAWLMKRGLLRLSVPPSRWHADFQDEPHLIPTESAGDV